MARMARWPDDRDFDHFDVKIFDLGASLPKDAVPDRLPQPADLRAPEVVFTGKFNHRVDLWCTGMTVGFLLRIRAGFWL